MEISNQNVEKKIKFNHNSCYEYALINEEEHKIIYVFT